MTKFAIFLFNSVFLHKYRISGPGTEVIRHFPIITIRRHYKDGISPPRSGKLMNAIIVSHQQDIRRAFGE